MKTLLIMLLGLLSANVAGQNGPSTFDIHTWQPPYKLAIPGGWTTERFPIPIDFAPQIPYKGVEDLRFASGWDKPTSDGYWSYAYLWWLEGTPMIDTASLQKNLTAYYSGLVARNVASRRIPARKVVPTTVVLTQLKSTVDGSELYSGTITMLDYMTQNPMRLTCLIHVEDCKEQKHRAVFFELSPKPVNHAIWQQLHAVQRDFACQN